MTLEELEAQVQQLLVTDTETLITQSRPGGTERYDEARSQIEEFKQAMRRFDSSAMRLLPHARLQRVIQVAERILGQINRLREPPSHIGGGQVFRRLDVKYFTQQHYEANTTSYKEDQETLWSFIVESLVLKQADSVSGSSDFEKRVHDLSDLLDTAKGVKEKLDGVLTTAQQDLGKVGVGKHSQSFEGQAKEYERQANFWLGWSIKLIVVNAILIVTVLAIVLLAMKGSSVEVADRIEVGIFGAVLVSLVSFAIVLCVRNYFAAKHNEIVNRHKANCLGTYDTFIDSADPDRKAAVLLQATQTIFSHQRSGYLSKEAEVSSPNPIIEVVRHMPAAKGD